jgi:hypothetical protein
MCCILKVLYHGVAEVIQDYLLWDRIYTHGKHTVMPLRNSNVDIHDAKYAIPSE